MLMRLLTAMVTVLALVATACGATEPPPPSSTVTTPDGPTTTLSHVDPEPPAVDPAPGWTVAFEAGTPWGPDGHGEGGYWESGLLVGEKGLLVTAIGEGEGSGVVDLYRSNDGASWERLDPVFGSRGIEYFDIAVATPAGYLIGGFTFEEDVAEPWMLQSANGVEWSNADSDHGLGAIAASFIRGGPDAGIHGVITSTVKFGDSYIAAGNFEDSAMVWVSDDGTNWNEHVVAEGFGSWVTGLAVANDLVYAVGSAPAMTVWESSDGTSWTTIAGPEAFGVETSAQGEGGSEFFEEAYHTGNFAGVAPYGKGLAALISVQRRSGDVWCFVDAQSCNQQVLELVTSTDGREWQALPLPDDPTLAWDGSLGSADGSLVLVEANDGQLQVWTAGDLGAGVAIEAPVKPSLGFEIVQWDDTIEEGVTYGYAFWTHCGIDRLGEFNGQVWELVEDTTSDLSQEEWNNQFEMLYGTMVLVAPDRIEYTLSDVVIATYAPSSDPEEGLCA